MRAKGLKTAVYPSGSRAARAILCFALAAAILALSIWARRMLHVKPFFSLAPAPTAAVEPLDAGDQARASLDIALLGGEWYALQLGAFTGEEAARKLANEYTPRGAAGFVRLSEGAYRVYAAAYPTRADAQKVQTRLAAQGVSTYIQAMPRGRVTLRAGGAQKQVDALADACVYLEGLDDKLYALFTALDARQTDGETARAALLSESKTCGALAQRLLAAFDGAPPPALEPLYGLLTALAAEGARPSENESAARMGAALKKCHMTLIAGLLDFTGQM